MGDFNPIRTNDGAEAVAMDNCVHTLQNTAPENELCNKCIKLPLASMSDSETKPIDMGFLTQYSSSTCPICTIIWEAIRKHWGSSYPLDSTSTRPRLYIQSKKWCLYGKDHSTWTTYRTALAVTQQPPMFHMKRRNLPTDREDRFILAELELVAETSTASSRLKSIRRTIKPHLDLSLIRGWLETCQNHGRTYVDDDIFPGGFRLIDVSAKYSHGSVLHTSLPSQSYVGGEHDPYGLRTTKRNLHCLQQPSALRESTRLVGKRLPRTILDAMELCEAVGQRYLWVDCLCIVQDDREEKARLIHGMGHVYENASLTIFAVSGRDADAGLAGVSTRESLPCEKRHVLRTPTTILSASVAPVSLVEQLRNSYWNTRGWTYQEQTLSERRLYFTPDEALFECHSCKRHEGYEDDNVNFSRWRPGPPWWGRSRTSGMDEPLETVPPRQGDRQSNEEDYAAMISSYTRRDLSYSEEVLNAFTGIYQRCTSKDPSQLAIIATQGIRTSSVALSLLWFTSQSGTRIISRRTKLYGTTPATWSWASWVAPIDFVCVTDSSFPAAEIQFSFHGDKRCCFVSEWYLTYDDGVDLSRVVISENQWKASDWNKEITLHPVELLAMLPDKPQPHISESVVGALDFIAPCITFTSGFELRTNTKISKGGRLLVLQGFTDHCCIVKFDGENEDFTELVVIWYDGSYVALCVKTLEGNSKRVGVAIFTRYRRVWHQAINMGKMIVDWRHVQLR